MATSRAHTLLLFLLMPSMTVLSAENREAIQAFALRVPKAELHIHLEGTLEPDHYLELIARNGLEARYTTVEAVQERLLDQRDLNSFIEVYEELLSAMRTEDDFYEVALAYCRKVASQGVVYVEMFFDPQMHTIRDVPLETVMAGLLRARSEALSSLGLTLNFIACFNRDRSAESAAHHLEELVAWQEVILGIGLDNPEEIDFPKKFAPVYQRASDLGFRLTTHCDVNVPNTLQHHWDAIHLLRVERIDHGLNVIDDPALLELVLEKGIGLTACPTLLYLDLPGRMEARSGAVKALLEAGVPVCVNSDDPGMMRSLYVGDLLALTVEAAGLSREQALELARNSFRIAWLSEEDKARYLALVDAFGVNHPAPF
jgi:adenine deaminase